MSIFKKPFDSFRIKYLSVFKFGINLVSPARAQPEGVRESRRLLPLYGSISFGGDFYILLFVLGSIPDGDLYGDNFYALFKCDKLLKGRFLVRFVDKRVVICRAAALTGESGEFDTR